MGLLKKCKQPSVDDHCVQPSADGRSSVWLCQAADERIFGAYVCLCPVKPFFLVKMLPFVCTVILQRNIYAFEVCNDFFEPF